MDFKNLFINNNNFVYKFVHPTRTNLEQRQKNKLKYSFSHLFAVQPSEATQRKYELILILTDLSAMHGAGKINKTFSLTQRTDFHVLMSSHSLTLHSTEYSFLE